MYAQKDSSVILSLFTSRISSHVGCRIIPVRCFAMSAMQYMRVYVEFKECTALRAREILDMVDELYMLKRFEFNALFRRGVELNQPYNVLLNACSIF